MGCDIHLHIEIKMDGKWEHYANPWVDRCYALFGVMAGVRGDGPAIVEPKGLPEDMSIITRADYEMMERDAHTPSWLDEDEIDKLSRWLGTRKEGLEGDILHTFLFGNGLTSFKRYKDGHYVPPGCTAVRLVFWFDH